MRRIQLITLYAIAIIILIMTQTAEAHKLNLFLITEDGNLQVEGYFASGAPAMNCKVIVKDDRTGKVLVTGTTDKEGVALLPLPEGWSGTLLVELKASLGHMATAKLAVQPDNPKSDDKEINRELSTSSNIEGATHKSSEPQNHNQSVSQKPVLHHHVTGFSIRDILAGIGVIAIIYTGISFLKKRNFFNQ